MFGHTSYLGYTLLFCLPPLVLVWLRREFREVLVSRIRPILISTLIIAIYGCLIWPIAIHYGAWSYSAEKILNLKLFDYVYFEDVVWWFLVGLIFSSCVTLLKVFQDRGVDVVWREVTGLIRGFQYAIRGLQAVTLERNSTIHVAAATFVLLEGFLFRISAVEWLFVAAAIGLVLALELVNTAVERLASRVTSEIEPEIRLLKDAAAAAVLVACGAALIIGFVIFTSRILAALRV
jgi:undecaprenol kinase